MYELPTSVTVNGIEYKIRNRADYRTILGVISMLNDPELTNEEKLVTALIVFYEDVDDDDAIISTFRDGLEEAVVKMMWIVNGGDNNEIGHTSNHKLVDWQQDEQLIVSAINGVAKTEIRALEYLHWWTFLSYYMAIGECPLSTVINIRDKIATGEKLLDGEKQFRRKNPQYFRWKSEEIEAQNMFEAIWNKE